MSQMARYLVWMVGAGIVLSVMYGVVFPAVNEVVVAFGPGAQDGAIAKETLDTTRDIAYIWVPLMLAGVVVLIGFIVSYGLRGTSVRP